MVKCPVCGRDYQTAISLLKHVKLKARFDERHRLFWEEYVRFRNSDSYDTIYTETDIFRAFLKQKNLI